MQSIILVILLMICTTSSGHRCIINDPLLESVAEFNNTSFLEKISKLPATEVGDSTLCRMKVFIQYTGPLQFTRIEFTQRFIDNGLDDAMIYFITVATNTQGGTGNFQIYNIIEYACSGNECDKKFLTDHMNRLVKVNYTEFEQKIRPLLMGYGNKAGQCFVNSVVTQCPAGKCLGTYTQTEIESGQWKQACNENQGSSVSLQISFVFYLRDLNFDAPDIHMRCQYDKCNEMNTMVEVKSIIDHHYNILSVLEMFNYNAAKSTTPVHLLVTSNVKYITKQQTSSELTTGPQSSSEFTTNQQLLSTSVTNSTTSNTTTIKNKGRRIQSTDTMICIVLIAHMSRLGFQHFFQL